MSRKNLYTLLLGISAVLSVLAVITLLPNPGISRQNLLGYKSVCPFSPAGTLILCWITSIVCTFRARVKDDKKNKEKPVILIILSVIFVSGILFYSVQYAKIKADFSKLIRETKVSASINLPVSGEYWAGYSGEDVAAEVTVIIKEGKIADIRLISGRNIENTVAAQVFQKIISIQSPAVDSVSGATASSLALMKAVEKALSESR
jgi:uncharacterized protein with FMN-binding domain